MQTKFCTLTDGTGAEVIVNPALVRCLMSAASGMTRLYFDTNHTVTVRGSPQEVEGKLTAAIEFNTFLEPH